MERPRWLGEGGPHVVAHRGASAVAPENTMAAFLSAVDLGADAIEFDVQQTADGELVVIHDASLDRTTTSSGDVFATTWAHMRELDVGTWFDPAHADERVPRLRDVLELADVGFELEMKGVGREFVSAVVEAVARAGAVRRVKFTSGNVSTLTALRDVLPAAHVGTFTPLPQPWMSPAYYEHHVLGTAETSPATSVHVYASVMTPTLVRGLHALGREAHANNAVGADEIRRALDSGVDSLSSDDLDVALRLRRR